MTKEKQIMNKLNKVSTVEDLQGFIVELLRANSEKYYFVKVDNLPMGLYKGLIGETLSNREEKLFFSFSLWDPFPDKNEYYPTFALTGQTILRSWENKGNTPFVLSIDNRDNKEANRLLRFKHISVRDLFMKIFRILIEKIKELNIY